MWSPELYVADEVFSTGTLCEITPVLAIDRLPVGSGSPGSITAAEHEVVMGLGILLGEIPVLCRHPLVDPLRACFFPVPFQAPGEPQIAIGPARKPVRANNLIGQPRQTELPPAARFAVGRPAEGR
jgi:hypothetical protein